MKTKKIIMVLACTLILAGCSANDQPETQAETQAEEQQTVSQENGVKISGWVLSGTDSEDLQESLLSLEDGETLTYWTRDSTDGKSYKLVREGDHFKIMVDGYRFTTPVSDEVKEEFGVDR